MRTLAVAVALVLTNVACVFCKPTFEVFYTNLRWTPPTADRFSGQGVMVDPDSPLTVSWGLSCGSNTLCNQSSYRVILSNGRNSSTAASSVGMQQHTFPVGTLCPSTRYWWSVEVTISSEEATSQLPRIQSHNLHSPDLPFFTAPAWGSSRNKNGDSSETPPIPIWAPKNRTNSPAMYAFLKTTMPPGPPITGCLLYITARAPTAAIREGNSGSEKQPSPRPPKILGVYKLWVGGTIVGMGPGRGRCSPGVVCGPTGTPYATIEQVFDGYDVTSLVSSSHDQPIDFFITGYGVDQSGSYNSGEPKVAVEIHVWRGDNTAASVVSTSDITMWQSYDADKVYSPGENSGCEWYFYPTENFNSSCLPIGTPLAPNISMLEIPSIWTQPQSQSPFQAKLTPKPVAPITVLSLEQNLVNVTQVDSNRFLVDLGREIQGGLKVSLLRSFASPIIVQVTLAEELIKPGEIMFPPRTGTNPRVLWILDSSRGGAAEHHEYGEFRYAELHFNTSLMSSPTRRKSESLINLYDFQVSSWVVRLPYDEANAASVSTTSPNLNDVWELCRYTIQASSLDLYSDSNARQRSADCTADDVTAMQTQYATSTELSLQRYALQQLLANGPDDSRKPRVDWKLLPIMAIEHDMMHTGDLSLASKVFDYIKANLTSMESMNSQSGLSEGTEALVDWPPGMMDNFQRSNISTVANAWIYYGLTALARIAGHINRTDDQMQLVDEAERLKDAMNRAQWDAIAGAFCDGMCTDASHHSFHATVYSLAFGAVANDNRNAAWHYIRGRIDPPFSPLAPVSVAETSWPPPPPPGSKDGLPCGVYPSQFALAALYSNRTDRGHAALQVLTSDAKNSWISMLRKGATMTMEMWNQDEKPNLTWSHPWGSSPGFIIAWYLFGIRPLEPGWAALSIMPQVGDLEAGEYSMPTVRGRISVAFTNSNSEFQLHVELPPTKRALIAVPIVGDMRNNILLYNNRQVRAQRIIDGYAEITVHGGGSHQIIVTGKGGLSGIQQQS